MTGWLGSGIPIPGLRKSEAPPAEPAEPTPTEPIEESKPEGKEDDDNSRYIRYEGLADAMSLRSYFLHIFSIHINLFMLGMLFTISVSVVAVGYHRAVARFGHVDLTSSNFSLILLFLITF